MRGRRSPSSWHRTISYDTSLQFCMFLLLCIVLFFVLEHAYIYTTGSLLLGW